MPNPTTQPKPSIPLVPAGPWRALVTESEEREGGERSEEREGSEREGSERESSENTPPDLPNDKPPIPDGPIPQCVALIDPVTATASSQIDTISAMLSSIHSIQSTMADLTLTPSFSTPKKQSVDEIVSKANFAWEGTEGAMAFAYGDPAAVDPQLPRAPRRREQIVGEPLESLGTKVQHKVIPKSDETRRTLQSALCSHFLFSDLEDDGTIDVIDTMLQEEVLEGMVIIQQGESGDKFYVLESGGATIKVNNSVAGKLRPGSAFGELALMWNSPRAATIVATEDCVLWTLSRPLFRRLLATSSSSQTALLCDFLKNIPLLKPLGNQETTKIARALRGAMFSDGEYIIRQGEEGDLFYLIYKGSVICTRSDEDGHERELMKLGAGDFFGERALQLKEPRKANVIARGDVECFTLSQQQFQLLLGSIQDVIYHITTARVLKSVPLLTLLSDEALYSLTNIFTNQTLSKGEFVITEGSEGDHFYVVHDGAVLVTQWSTSMESQVELDMLGSGQYFGEIALLTRAPRTASVQVVSERAELLVMHRDDFQTFMQPFQNQIQEQMEKRESAAMEKLGKAESQTAMGFGVATTVDDGQGTVVASWLTDADREHLRSRNESLLERPAREMQQVVLEDLEIIATLGTGTFGKVVMVSHRLTGEVNALKCLQKAHLIRTKQQDNVKREKAAMQVMDHQFIVQLRGTLSDSNQVYLLLEFLSGGELWSLLYENKESGLGGGPWGGMELNTCMHFAAMCVSAFEHIHSKKYCYRDLKPENLLLGGDGYLKLADFGFAKKLPYTDVNTGKSEDRTFTLCGTPEYMAPEIVLSRGHDSGVDFWACGILIYEMLCGTTPFEAGSQQETFERIVYSQRYLRFPLGFDPHAKSLIRKLLESNSALRLGALRGGVEDVKEHLFFSATQLDWEALKRREIKMEYVPQERERAGDGVGGEGESSSFEGEGVVEEYEAGEDGDTFWDF